jgi:branched-chain amino acid transport system substrate-binding protein
MRRSMAAAVGALALASMGIAACGSSGGSSAASGSTSSSGGSTAAAGPKTPFNILAIVASSGSLAAVTQSELQGMQAAAKYANAHGGFDGQPVKITVKNDNLDPTTAANLLQAALSSGTKPDMVYAGTTSDEAAALMPILTQNKIFSLQVDVSDDTINPSKNPYAFSVSTRTADFGAEVAAVTKARYPNAKKVGIIIGNDVNGSSLLQSEKPNLEKQGYKVVVETYDPANTVNMTPQMEALKAQNPQVLIASGFGAPAGYILKARAQIGWNVPVVGDASFSANPLPSMASASALNQVNVLANDSAVYQPPSKWSAAFKTLYKAVAPASGKFEVPFGLYETGWDTIMVAQAAANQAKSFDTTALTNALQNLKTQSSPLYLIQSYKYTATQHTPVADLSQVTLASPYTKDGRFLPFGQKS